VRADRNLTLAAQDQISVLDLYSWTGYDPVNQDGRMFCTLPCFAVRGCLGLSINMADDHCATRDDQGRAPGFITDLAK
jgi:hypothetical protein